MSKKLHATHTPKKEPSATKLEPNIGKFPYHLIFIPMVHCFEHFDLESCLGVVQMFLGILGLFVWVWGACLFRSAVQMFLK